MAVKRSREGTLAGGIESPAIKELAFLTELQASQAVVPLAPGVLDADAELAGSHRRASGAASRALDSGAFVHKRQLYLVMEPCACDVSGWIASSDGLSPTSRLAAGLAVARGALQALERVHSRGWCHRDIKPGNVLLRSQPGGARASLAGGGHESCAAGAEAGGPWHASAAAARTGGAATDAPPRALRQQQRSRCAGVVLADAGLACRLAPGPCSGLQALAAVRASLAAEDPCTALWAGGCGGAAPCTLPARSSAGDGSEGGSEHSSPMPWEAACWAPAVAPAGSAEAATPPPRRVCAQAGTLWYRAPELLFGAPRHGPAADVWAAACLAWEAFVGRGDNAEPLLRADSEMAQLRVISELLGPARPEVWPGIALAAPYMAGGGSPDAEGGAPAQATRPERPAAEGLWGTRPALPAAVEACRARVQAKLLERLRASHALGSGGGGDSSRDGGGGGGGGRGGADEAAPPAGSRPPDEALESVASLLSHMLLYDPDLRPAASQCLAHPVFSTACPLGDVVVPPLRVEPRRQAARPAAAQASAAAASARPAFATRFSLGGASPGGLALAFPSPGASPRARGFPAGSGAAASPKGGNGSAARHASGGRLLFADPPSTGASSAVEGPAMGRALRLPAPAGPFSPLMRPSALAFDDVSPGSQASPGIGGASLDASSRRGSARKRPRGD